MRTRPSLKRVEQLVEGDIDVSIWKFIMKIG